MKPETEPSVSRATSLHSSFIIAVLLLSFLAPCAAASEKLRESRIAKSAAIVTQNGSASPILKVTRLSLEEASPLPPKLVHNIHPRRSGASNRNESAAVAAASTCEQALGVKNHAYSIGFTTCGNAVGVYTGVSFYSGDFNVDPCCHDSHVNATMWFAYFTSAGAYQGLEVGYWKSDLVTDPADGCYYAGTYIGTTYRSYCLQKAPNTSGISLEIDAANNAGSKTYRVYLGGEYKASYTIGATVSHRLDTGVEEQASTLSSGNTSNRTGAVYFDAALYHQQGTAGFRDWGKFSHCRVDYSKNNSFGPDAFPTSHTSEINGRTAGTYAACNGSAPTSGRTTW